MPCVRSVPQERIWSTALAAGMKEAEPPSLVTTPTLFGERHQPDQKGSVENINQVIVAIMIPQHQLLSVYFIFS